MQKQWVGKNVDLVLLSGCVEDFFRDRGFETKKEESEGKYTISWAPPWAYNMRGAMTVTIVGDSKDFSVELIASERSRRSILLGQLMSLFGGGYLLLRGLKMKEALEKLENEFWAYVEEKVAHLTGSAQHVSRLNRA